MALFSPGQAIRTLAFATGLLIAGSAMAIGAEVWAGGSAHAACNGAPSDEIPYPRAVSPGTGPEVHGPAPLNVAIAINESAILSTPVTSSLNWGDGSGNTVVNVVPCGDDLYSFPAQQHSHLYASPGTYPVVWNIVAQGAPQIAPIIVFVTVEAAVATPAPPEPTAIAPTPAPATPAPATPAPTAPAPGTAIAPTVFVPAITVAPTAAESRTAEPSPSASPTSTPTAGATATPTLAPTTTPTVAASPVAAIVRTLPTELPRAVRPELFRSVPDVTDISTDGDVLATNLVFAGITIWVFFSSVLFNQTMQEHRSEVSSWFRWARRPGGLRRLPMPHGMAGALAAPAAVLAGMGIIYGFLEPGFGLNQRSLVLFLSVTIGVGLVGFFYSGLEAWARRKSLGSVASVRAFPLALLVALASVVLSKLLDLHPGVVYGFAASCVVLGGTPTEGSHEGRALALPVTACLALSVLCWLLVAPARAFPIDGVGHLLEGIAVIVFIGGLEGLLVNLLPLDVMDGAKIYRWNRLAWVVLLLVSAFLFWHVLLNSQRQYFDSLRAASSASVLVAFLVYTMTGAGLWAWFKWRARTVTDAASVLEERPTGGS